MSSTAGTSAEARPVMITGGAGFLGSHLADALLLAGEHVDVIDDLRSGSLANLGAARASGALKFHHADATSNDGLAVVALRRPRLVYHLALLPPGGDDLEAATTAFTSVATLCARAQRAGVEKVVVALPAVDVYGRPSGRELPVKEQPLVPRGLRGVAASAAVDVLTHFRDTHGLEFTALALSTVYGPRQRADAGVVAAFVAAAVSGTAPIVHGDGRQTRDLLYVDDAVEALVSAGERGGGLVINVGTGVQTPIRELAERLTPEGASSSHDAPRPDEVGRFAVSPVRARIHLSWSPWTSLDDGITETVAAARAARRGEDRGGEPG